jgi:hypothetical protein
VAANTDGSKSIAGGKPIKKKKKFLVF